MLTRRFLIAAPAVVTAASMVRTSAAARAPLAGTATPPVFRFKLGSFEITALSDGALDIPLDTFPAAKQDEATAHRLLDQAALPRGPLRTVVNAYVVNTGERLVLVDAGTGNAMGPGLGHLTRNLLVAGFEPSAIDMVLLTHLHPDHAGGLRTADGAKAFPNAEIIVADREYAAWHDDAVLNSASADVRPYILMARDFVKPYADRTRRSQPGEVTPGITLEMAPGHTLGHAMYRIASGSSQLLVWGDVMHSAALQMERPDWSLAFDLDPAQAAATRRRVFDLAASDRLLVAGMHLPFPGIGHLARRGDAYAFVPKAWPV